MLTAPHARFLTYAIGMSQRFVDFAVDAFESCRDPGSGENALWRKHFAGTGFESRGDEFSEVAAEILLSRSVDAFQFYLADIIGLALWRRPAVAGLREEAVRYATDTGIELNDALRQMAALHAERLSFRGFGAMVDFIETTFGVTIILDAKMRTNLRRIIAVRNMIAHNHARKNARYCKDVGEPETNVGQSVRPSLPEAKEAAANLASFVELVDSTIAAELNNGKK
jgi:hypothetical protein